jgi:hypothetical protein
VEAVADDEDGGDALVFGDGGGVLRFSSELVL